MSAVQGGPLLTAALSYAAQGWAVFPLQAGGKAPLKGTRGFKDATKDTATILEMWRRSPESNVGIRTGHASGLLVLDVDVGRDGDDSLFDLEQSYAALPPTVEAITGSGGRHIYFAAPTKPIRNSVDKLGVGLDVRGEGGYVVAPPSRLASRGAYDWEASYHPDDISPATPPAWLLAALELPTEAPVPGQRITSGSRNATLVRQAGYLVRAGLDKQAITAALDAQNQAANDPPLDDAEVRRIATNAATWRTPPPWMTRPAVFLASLPPTLGPGTRAVLWVFVSSAKSDGMATLSLSRIGELAGMSKPAASGHVGRLIKAGYLEPGTTSRRCGTRYRLTSFAGYIGNRSCQLDPRKGVKGEAKNVAPLVIRS